MGRVPASLQGQRTGRRTATTSPFIMSWRAAERTQPPSKTLRSRPRASLRHHLPWAPEPRRRHVLGFGEIVGVDDIYPLLERRSVIGHQVADEIGFEMCCRLSRPGGAMGHSWVQGAHPHSGTGEKCLLTVGKATGHRASLHWLCTHCASTWWAEILMKHKSDRATRIASITFRIIFADFTLSLDPVRSSLCHLSQYNPRSMLLSSSHHTFFPRLTYCFLRRDDNSQ